ncbi:MAG: hypothetical protein DHS20C20_24050 [Ardenticatenaceae bacterium]|nr:MAG: hypothetical protein DHS20C20_24050 [Ardenticatenaceae bacterium]
MSNDNPSKTDQILDLLLDALQERQTSRQQPENQAADSAIGDTPATVDLAPDEAAVPSSAEATAEIASSGTETNPQLAAEETTDEDEAWEPYFLKESTPPELLPSIELDKMLRRLAIAVGILLLLVNIPFNQNGLSLARAMPDAQSLIIRDGLVLKGSGEEIYVLENNQKRWISSLEAFEWYNYRWEQVNVVDDAFLNRFEDGRPLHVLLKCQTSPHIYALEDGQKRWIKDIPTFEAEGFVWEDIKFVSCAELRRLPTGTPIPADAGPSPEP